MNKKGFTLIELLAVILILGIIMLIAIPVVNNTITQARKGAFTSTINTIEKEASQSCKMDQLQSQDGVITYTFNNGEVSKSAGAIHDLEVKGDLPDSGTVSTNANCDIKMVNVCKGNYCANKNFSDEKVVITDNTNPVSPSPSKDKEISYDIPGTDETFTCKVKGIVNPIKTVYFNPETGAKCSASAAVSTTGTKTGCMKWYVYNENSNGTVDMILDHNTTAKVDWNSTGSNVSGPKEVLDLLKEDTKNWNGVTTRTDSYTYDNGTINYTINYNGYKARLITANEIAKITGNTSFDEKTAIEKNRFMLDSCVDEFAITIYMKVLEEQGAEAAEALLPDYFSKNHNNYYWLYDYLSNCNRYGCKTVESTVLTIGYWTASVASFNSSFAWYIYAGGNLLVGSTNPSHIGVRPVITVSKSSI